MHTEKHLRPIRSFVRRCGRLTSSQKHGLEKIWPKFGVEFQLAPLNYSVLFGRSSPVNIEIGFGMAENLLAVAATHPDENFIGIDVHTPGVGHALNQIEEAGINNIRIINHDAVEVLTHQIPDHSLSSVSIFFPDPWHKTKHRKRRLITPIFTQLLATKLHKNGHVYMATDWEDYAKQMLAVFNANLHFENQSHDKKYCERMAFRPLTKFERRGHRLGHGVWDLIFKRI